MTCPACGASIGSDSAVCPACLLQFGLAGDAETVSSPGVSPDRPSTGSRLKPGQRFGPYRIERLLGRGGMGEVYEAEQVDDGRRVALKTLNQALSDERDRARFVREGQLAASVNHPNVVYIFGAEEIEGAPVIAMELVAGGTLKDRVSRDGPMPPAEAVDAMLDVISGLDAAQAAGILHRDIKPSNCFVDRDGTVKIGDFGLSISTMARGVSPVTIAGVVQGTPQFASPEQLKGAPLDVRSDIYAAGATLYYLLTGRPPFEADDLVTLLARVASDPPSSPRARQPRVPKALAAVVLSCLAKEPAARPAGYAALAERLRPFGSSSREGTPPPLGLRFMAGVVDYLGFTAIVIGLGFVLVLAVNLLSLPEPPEPPVPIGWIVFPFFVPYLAVSEAYFGGALGKRLLGLRVVSHDGSGRLRLSMALLRSGIYVAFLALANGVMRLSRLIAEATVEISFFADTLALVGGAASFLGMLGLLFATARRSNGLAALQDVASRTRVVQRAAAPDPRAAHTARAPGFESLTLADEYIGPYRLVADPQVTPPEGLVAGFDEALRRPVWIARVSPAAPPVSTSRRDLARPTRLRWLGGSRSGDAWDAWEASAGVPLTAWFRKPLAWREVRTALAHLVNEVRAGMGDGSLPELRLDRVWIEPDGSVHLCEWPARHGSSRGGGEAARDADVDEAVAGRFLHAVAYTALGTNAPADPPASITPAGVRVPLSARRLLNDLRRARVASLDEVVGRLAALEAQPVAVSRLRRAMHLLISGLLPAQMALFAILITAVFAEDTTLGRASDSTRFQLVTGSTGVFMVMLNSLFVAIPSRGGFLLRLLGIAVVDVDGRQISPLRGLVRAAVAWLPALLWGSLLLFGPTTTGPTREVAEAAGWVIAAVVALMILFIAGVVFAVVRPERGFQDHIAGTWLVPR
jgi:hypothetical protein